MSRSQSRIALVELNEQLPRSFKPHFDTAAQNEIGRRFASQFVKLTEKKRIATESVEHHKKAEPQ